MKTRKISIENQIFNFEIVLDTIFIPIIIGTKITRTDILMG